MGATCGHMALWGEAQAVRVHSGFRVLKHVGPCEPACASEGQALVLAVRPKQAVRRKKSVQCVPLAITESPLAGKLSLFTSASFRTGKARQYNCTSLAMAVRRYRSTPCCRCGRFERRGPSPRSC